MMPLSKLGGIIAALACAGSSFAEAGPKGHTINIDGEEWTLTRTASQCEDRSSVAIEEYWKAPLYSEHRKPVPDRYLINQSTDCWIELGILGVSDISVLIKVSEENDAIDKRLFSTWHPRVTTYPHGPLYLD